MEGIEVFPLDLRGGPSVVRQERVLDEHHGQGRVGIVALQFDPDAAEGGLEVDRRALDRRGFGCERYRGSGGEFAILADGIDRRLAFGRVSEALDDEGVHEAGGHAFARLAVAFKDRLHPQDVVVIGNGVMDDGAAGLGRHAGNRGGLGGRSVLVDLVDPAELLAGCEGEEKDEPGR